MALVSDMLWSDGVFLTLGKAGGYRVVLSTRNAENVLLNKWPSSGDDKHREALEICAKVMDGKLAPEAARLAFITAAEEAGILVSDKLPRHLSFEVLEPSNGKTELKFYPKKRGHRTYWR